MGIKYSLKVWTWIANVVCVAWTILRTKVCLFWAVLSDVVVDIWHWLIFTINNFDCNVPANPVEKKGWKLVFNDEFNGSALDTTKWNTHAPWMAWQTSLSPAQWGLYPFFMPNPREYFDPSSISVNNSVLTIRSEYDPKSFFYHDPSTLVDAAFNIKYKCGYIETLPVFKQQHGFFEIRCKIPNGSGAWPAFWLMGDSPDPWPPEIDVFEFSTSENTKSVQMTNIHWGTEQNPQGKGKNYQICNAGENFHIYGLEWTPNYIKWYFNNQLVRTETQHMGEFSYLFKVIVSCGMEDYITNPAIVNGLPHQFEIDYVRIYK